jgi:hypothetical protein
MTELKMYEIHFLEMATPFLLQNISFINRGSFNKTLKYFHIPQK